MQHDPNVKLRLLQYSKRKQHPRKEKAKEQIELVKEARFTLHLQKDQRGHVEPSRDHEWK